MKEEPQNATDRRVRWEEEERDVYVFNQEEDYPEKDDPPVYLVEHCLPEYAVNTPIVCPAWRQGNSSSECKVCKKAFSLFNRKRHCRSCGEIVCAGCLYSATLLIPSELVRHWSKETLAGTSSSGVRVCMLCWHIAQPSVYLAEKRYEDIPLNTLLACPNDCNKRLHFLGNVGSHLRYQCPRSRVVCPWGCGWTATREEFKVSGHGATCKRKLVLCPYSCGMHVRRGLLEEHALQECRLRPTPCKLCGRLKSPEEMQRHLENFCRGLVKCGACGEEMRRCDLAAHKLDCPSIIAALPRIQSLDVEAPSAQDNQEELFSKSVHDSSTGMGLADMRDSISSISLNSNPSRSNNSVSSNNSMPTSSIQNSIVDDADLISHDKINLHIAAEEEDEDARGGVDVNEASESVKEEGVGNVKEEGVNNVKEEGVANTDNQPGLESEVGCDDAKVERDAKPAQDVEFENERDGSSVEQQIKQGVSEQVEAIQETDGGSVPEAISEVVPEVVPDIQQQEEEEVQPEVSVEQQIKQGVGEQVEAIQETRGGAVSEAVSEVVPEVVPDIQQQQEEEMQPGVELQVKPEVAVPVKDWKNEEVEGEAAEEDASTETSREVSGETNVERHTHEVAGIEIEAEIEAQGQANREAHVATISAM